MDSKYALPDISTLKTYSRSKFIEQNGYVYAGTFIEYVYNRYGKDKVLELIKSNSYEKVLEKDIETIFDEWKDYLKNRNYLY
jgi:hypothetical protein